MDQLLTKSASINQQIIAAMDGRTKRWLSLEVKIPESEFSRKIKGHINFTPEELIRIEARLQFTIQKV